jgi:two-component system invasion response regulator UvrY
MNSDNNIKLMIADDHVIIWRGLKFLMDQQFNIKNTVKATSCIEVLQELKKDQFTHLILDLQLMDDTAMTVLPEIRQNYPDLAILVFTMNPEELYARRLLDMGVRGFLSKLSPEEEVIRALQLFFTDRVYISDALQERIRGQESKTKSNNPLELLSERETDVLNYLLQGERVSAIAQRMNLKVSTVATFKARIFDKTGVENLLDLQRVAKLHSYTIPKDSNT